MNFHKLFNAILVITSTARHFCKLESMGTHVVVLWITFKATLKNKNNLDLILAIHLN